MSDAECEAAVIADSGRRKAGGAIGLSSTLNRSLPSKKNILKVPKRVHKAERERSKRDHMNTLFYELGKSLEPDHHDKGKASTLNHCIRLLHDLLAQVDCLRKENSALLSESHYAMMDKKPDPGNPKSWPKFILRVDRYMCHYLTSGKRTRLAVLSSSLKVWILLRYTKISTSINYII